MKLEVNNVAIDINTLRIVEDVRLNVSPGEIVGLIGPNGSGKSTLLRSVYRVLRPIAGQVFLDREDVWQMAARQSAQRTGVVVQEAPTDFGFTVAEVVAMGRTPHKDSWQRDTAEDQAIIQQSLVQVGMSTFVDRLYNTLSGGEKQRVLVARALAQQPKVLVLDEPTNHLDIRFQLEILELVKSLGLTTLITLHDLNLAAAYCQRLYLLANGRVVASGPPADVLTPAWVRQVFGVEAVIGQHPVTHHLQLSFMPSVI